MTQTDFNHLLSALRGLSPEQARQLRQQLDRQIVQPKAPTARARPKAAKRAKTAAPKRRMTEEEFDQHLLKIGLVSSLPDPALDLDDDDPDDQPVSIKGEPLSETIIRERR
jgi:bZIP Maf transcription factor